MAAYFLVICAISTAQLQKLLLLIICAQITAFTHGKLTVCPYLVFAARTSQSLHKAGEFIIGNIFQDPDIAEKLDAYKFNQRYRLGANQTCDGCNLNAQCGKGCPAAVIASGKRIEEVDADVCPGVNQ